jgi:zinc/manganese transport system substrate-binding protein
MVGAHVEVVTIMPTGTAPHEFQASARQAAEMRSADALVVNGGGFEEGLDDVIAGATDDGVPTFVALDAVDTLPIADDPDVVDPHFFSDPARMAEAATAALEFLTEAVPELGTDDVRADAEAYLASLAEADAGAEQLLGSVPAPDRTLVTDHEVLGYFADRYGFEVIGSVIPGASTTDAASAGDLAALADTIRATGVPAVFTASSSSSELAETLADEVGDVEVVELFSEALGEPGSGGETYLDMVRTNASRIAEALG